MWGFFDLVFWVSSVKYPEEELLGPFFFLSLVIAFVLKSILFGIKIAMTAFFFFYLAFNFLINILKLIFNGFKF